jgi:hypothetical protein
LEKKKTIEKNKKEENDFFFLSFPMGTGNPSLSDISSLNLLGSTCRASSQRKLLEPK